MIRRAIALFAIVLTLAAATSAQAMTFSPLSQPNDMITKVVSTCGAVHTSGRHGACETRHIRRCVRHRHSGVCLRYQ